MLAIEEVASACYQTAMAVLGELGVQTQAIVHFGSEAHKERYFPAVARGELICAICMTEADAGSDLGALPRGRWRTATATSSMVARS